MQRTHDSIYLDENRYDNTKENFKFILSQALQFAAAPPRSVLDVGCAAGEFAYYLTRALPGCAISGVDVLPELIAKAKEKVPSAKFSVGSALDTNAVTGQFDMVFFVGVHSIFDEIEPWLSNLLQWTKPGGIVAVFGLINSHPVDAIIRVRTQHGSEVHLEPGWNNYSRATFEKTLRRFKDVEDVKFIDFVIPIDIPRNSSDALRSWTEKDVAGQRYIVNGIGLIHDFKLMCIKKKP